MRRRRNDRLAKEGVKFTYLARTVLPLLEREEDDAGLNYIWDVFGYVANYQGRYEDATHAAEQALRYGLVSRRLDANLFAVGAALARGPRPADEALRTLDALLPENPNPQQLLCRAELLTMLARFDEADQIAREAGERFRDLTGDDSADDALASIAETAGRHEDAAVHLRRFCDQLEARGLRGVLSTYAPALGHSFCSLGRYDEAEPLARLGRELGTEDDTITQALWRRVQALVDAHRGRFSEAEQLAREAVVLSETTDALNWQGDDSATSPKSSTPQAETTRPRPLSPRRSSAMNAGATLPRQHKCATAWLRSGANPRANRRGRRRRRAGPSASGSPSCAAGRPATR